MGGIELTMEEERSDEDQAWRENTEFEQSGTPMKPAEFFENHRMHEQVHGMLLKSASALEWPPEKRIALIEHLLSHAMFLNPQVAQQLKVQYGLAPPMPVISQPPSAGPAAPPGAPPQAPPAPGAPAPIPPPGGAAMAPPPPQ
jgi:hypothetical protein